MIRWNLCRKSAAISSVKVKTPPPNVPLVSIVQLDDGGLRRFGE